MDKTSILYSKDKIEYKIDNINICVDTKYEVGDICINNLIYI